MTNGGSYLTCLPHVFLQFDTVDTFDLHYYVKVVEINCILLLSHVAVENQLLHK